jgi:thioredoxin 1
LYIFSRGIIIRLAVLSALPQFVPANEEDVMIIEVTDATFDSQVLKSNIPFLLDFWAPWCGPCRAIGPVIEELSKEYEGKISTGKMNVDENQVTPGKFGIRAIPTIILFKNGEVVDQITGAVSKNNISAIIDQKALA